MAGSDDIRNCHSEIRRAQVAPALDGVPQVRDLIPGLTADMLPKHHLWVREEGGGLRLLQDADGGELVIEDGLQQGHAPSSMACSLVLLGHTRAADAILAPHGGRTRGYQDDHRHVGPLAPALRAAEVFADGIRRGVGLAMNPAKRRWYSPSPEVRAELRARGVPLGIVRPDGSAIKPTDADYAAPPAGSGYGISVMGAPVGDAAYVAAFMRRKADQVVGDIISTLSSLRSRSLHAMHAVAHYCLAPRADHWLQLLPPRLSRDFGLAVDGAMERVLRACLGDSSFDVGLLRRRVRQPVRHRGVGYRTAADSGDGISLKAHAGFVGSVAQAIPRMLDSVSSDGRVTRGYTPGLAARIGAGSFDEAHGGRYRHLLVTGCALGRDVSASWVELQAAAAVGPGALPAAALLSGPADVLAFGTCPRQLQHHLTDEVEGRRALELEADLARLPAGHPYRDAYDECDDVARAWVRALPRPSSRLDNVAFVENVCVFLGAPIPACVAVRTTRVPQARGADRCVGDYGGPLLSAGGDGLWSRSHRGIQQTVAADVRDHGGHARLEVAGAFAAALEELRLLAPPPAWDDASQDSCLAGYIPDLSIRFPGAPAELWEVKVMHVNPKCYQCCTAPGGARRPPTALGAAPCGCAPCRRTQGHPIPRRARRVLNGVRFQLRALERRLGWDHATRGPGPLLRRLDDLGGVHPLVSGAFGGVNAEWRELLRRMAGSAALSMFRRLLLPSPSQAQRVLYARLCERAHFQLARDRHHLLHERLARLLPGGPAGAAHAWAARVREEERADGAHAFRARGPGPVPASPPRR